MEHVDGRLMKTRYARKQKKTMKLSVYSEDKVTLPQRSASTSSLSVGDRLVSTKSDDSEIMSTMDCNAWAGDWQTVGESEGPTFQ